MSDDQLFSVESVALSSDGLKATITLANSGSAGASVVGLSPNVDYNMIVTSDGDTASKIFSIPATLSNVTVSGFDADKDSISVGSGNDENNGPFNWSTYATLTVPADMTVDYNDLLGRTVTVKYDKKMNLTSLVVDPDETVIYGAFKGSFDNENLTEVVSEATFKAQNNAAGTIDPSALIEKTATGWTTTPTALTSTKLKDNTLAYSWGKLVLNPNNTIKALVADPSAWTMTMLITATKDNTLLAGTTEQNVKDYTILEGGLTIGIDDIEEGDMVFVDQTKKFAVVYNNSETGELEAVYDGKFKFGGEVYDVVNTGTPTLLDSKVYYNKDGAGRTQVDNDYLNALVAGGEDVTVYFGPNGQPAYLVGEVGATVTTTEPLVLTAASKFYTEKLSNYFRVKGFNGEEVKTYDIDLSKLEFIVDANGKTWKKGYDEYIKGTANPSKNPNKKGFKVGTVTITTAGAGSITQDGNAGAGNLITHATLGQQAYVTLTKNDKDQVIGINFEDLGAGNQLRDNVDFKSGLKVVNGLQIDGSTPIYVYKETDPNKDTVTKFDFADFSGVVAKENQNKVHLYSSNDKDVTAVVIQSSGLAGDTTGQTTQEVVVKSYKKTTDSTPKLAELTVIYQGIETTFTKFASTSEGETPVAGDIYTLVINKDGETVDGLSTVTDLHRTTIDVTSVDSQEFTLDQPGLDLTKRKLSTTVAPTIVKFENGAYVPGTFADLQDAAAYIGVRPNGTTGTSPKQINWSWLAGSDDYVDTIVVTGTALAAAKTAELTKIGNLAGTVTTQTASLSSATSSTFDVSGITTADIDLAGAGAMATSADFTAGAVTLNGAASTLSTTGASAGEHATITITTALGNPIVITLETEAVRAASLSSNSLSHAVTTGDDEVIGAVDILNQYGVKITNAATTVVYEDATMETTTTKIDGTAATGTITFAQNGGTAPSAGTYYAKVTAADGTTVLGVVTITLAA